MKKTPQSIIAYLFIIISFVSISKSYAQVEGYGSISIGYDKNPLYNYQSLSDQIKQSYLELKYSKDFSKSVFTTSYISGLTLFNQISDRNYYEHSLNMSYQIKFLKDIEVLQPRNPIQLNKLVKEDSVDSTKYNISDSLETVSDDSLNTTNSDSLEIKQQELSEENNSESDEQENPVFNSLTFGLKIGARHNKEVFDDYNNFGLEFLTSYKNVSNPSYPYELKNVFGFRNYLNISGLSNITDILSFDIRKVTEGGFSIGINCSAGMQYYTQTIFDTTQVITKRKNPRKPPSVQISLTPKSNGTYQLTTGLLVSQNWNSTNVELNILYRYNFKSGVRYLAAAVNTIYLSEDIYNDFFTYQGLGGKFKIIQKLPFDIQLSIATEIQSKRFTIPALNLLNQQIDPQRKDIQSNGEASISKYFEVGKRMVLDLTFTLGLMRNESNDTYNDCSSYNVSFGFGLGF